LVFIEQFHSLVLLSSNSNMTNLDKSSTDEEVDEKKVPADEFSSNPSGQEPEHYLEDMPAEDAPDVEPEVKGDPIETPIEVEPLALSRLHFNQNTQGWILDDAQINLGFYGSVNTGFCYHCFRNTKITNSTLYIEFICCRDFLFCHIECRKLATYTLPECICYGPAQKKILKIEPACGNRKRCIVCSGKGKDPLSDVRPCPVLFKISDVKRKEKFSDALNRPDTLDNPATLDTLNKPFTSDNPDTLNTSDKPDASDNLDTSDTLDKPDASDNLDTSDTLDKPETSGTFYKPETSDKLEISTDTSDGMWYDPFCIPPGRDSKGCITAMRELLQLLLVFCYKVIE